MKPILYVIIPCYNEEEVLEVTYGIFTDEITDLIKKIKYLRIAVLFMLMMAARIKHGILLLVFP